MHNRGLYKRHLHVQKSYKGNEIVFCLSVEILHSALYIKILKRTVVTRYEHHPFEVSGFHETSL
jgi:hypothetical protein